MLVDSFGGSDTAVLSAIAGQARSQRMRNDMGFKQVPHIEPQVAMRELKQPWARKYYFEAAPKPCQSQNA